jgi:hypothetical protein
MLLMIYLRALHRKKKGRALARPFRRGLIGTAAYLWHLWHSEVLKADWPL